MNNSCRIFEWFYELLEFENVILWWRVIRSWFLTESISNMTWTSITNGQGTYIFLLGTRIFVIAYDHWEILKPISQGFKRELILFLLQRVHALSQPPTIFFLSICNPFLSSNNTLLYLFRIFFPSLFIFVEWLFFHFHKTTGNRGKAIADKTFPQPNSFVTIILLCIKICYYLDKLQLLIWIGTFYENSRQTRIIIQREMDREREEENTITYLLGWKTFVLRVKLAATKQYLIIDRYAWALNRTSSDMQKHDRVKVN